jgi:hypothetical protein
MIGPSDLRQLTVDSNNILHLQAESDKDPYYMTIPNDDLALNHSSTTSTTTVAL